MAIAATFGLSTLLNVILWFRRSEMIGSDAEQEKIEMAQKEFNEMSGSTNGPSQEGGKANKAYQEE